MIIGVGTALASNGNQGATLEEKLEYFNTIKDEMKVVTPQLRREFNKLKYGIAFA